MLDLILAALGRRTCPWCNPDRRSPIRDWLADHLPYRAYAGLHIGSWDYNAWVGKVAVLHLHSKHEETR